MFMRLIQNRTDLIIDDRKFSIMQLLTSTKPVEIIIFLHCIYPETINGVKSAAN